MIEKIPIYLFKLEDINIPYVVHTAQGFLAVRRELKVSWNC